MGTIIHLHMPPNIYRLLTTGTFTEDDTPTIFCPEKKLTPSGTEALRTEKKGPFLCASMSPWLMQSNFSRLLSHETESPTIPFQPASAGDIF